MVDGARESEWRPMRSAGFLAIALVIAGRTGKARLDPLAALPPFPADPGLAEEDVEDDSSDRQRQHRDDPGEARSRFAMRAQKRADDRRCVGKDDNAGSDLFPVHVGQCRILRGGCPALPSAATEAHEVKRATAEEAAALPLVAQRVIAGGSSIPAGLDIVRCDLSLDRQDMV